MLVLLFVTARGRASALNRNMAHLHIIICIEWMGNWRFNSPDKDMRCIEFLLMRHTPNNFPNKETVLGRVCMCVDEE